MRMRNCRKQKWLWNVTVFLLVIVFCLSVFFKHVRPIIFRYAVSTAETLILDAANRAVVAILDENGITYRDIVLLSRDSDGRVTSLETDIAKINTLKSQISNRLSQIIGEEEYYTIRIPVGSFFSSTYTSGWGPKITFKMQLTATARVDFSNRFEAAGINQVLHVVMIDMNVSGSLVVPGGQDSISASTSVFAAQTLIVGAVPGAFTQVIEGGDGDLAGLINDYEAILE